MQTHTQKRLINNAVYFDRTQPANCRGKPPFSSYKPTLKQQLKSENEMQDTCLLLAELFCYVVLVSSAWGNVGETVNRR